MRIAFLSVSARIGGAEVLLLDLLGALRATEPCWPLTVLTPDDGPLADAVRGLGAEAAAVPMPRTLARVGEWRAGGSPVRALLGSARGSLSLSGYQRAVRAALDRVSPDLIHSNGFKMHLVSALVRAGSEALVWHMHDYAGRRPLSRALMRRLATRCDAIVANSASVAADTEAVVRGAVRVHLVPNAVNLARFSPDGPLVDLDGLSHLPPAPAQTVRVGLVATFSRWKGHEVFLRAIAALPSSLPVRAYIVGGPVYDTSGSQYTRAELETLARSLGVSDRVGFTGFAVEPERVMRSLDIVVHASTEPEPFGLVVAEAMACGRAVVTSASGGSAELVRDGIDAMVHPAGRHAGLAEALARLAGDATLRTQLGERARAHALDSFDSRRLGPAFRDVYRAAHAGRSKRP